jgi:hypothetical protein
MDNRDGELSQLTDCAAWMGWIVLFTEKLRTFVVLFADEQHEGPQQPPAEVEVEAGLDQAAGQLQQPQQQLQQPSSPASSTGSDSADTVVWTEEEMAAMRQERIAADVDWLDLETVTYSETEESEYEFC